VNINIPHNLLQKFFRSMSTFAPVFAGFAPLKASLVDDVRNWCLPPEDDEEKELLKHIFITFEEENAFHVYSQLQ